MTHVNMLKFTKLLINIAL